MSIQIDYNDPRYAQAAAEILRRHENGEPEANITSAVRDFLILTGLVRADEIVEENPPAQDSRRAVDLAALDAFIEFKRRIGTVGSFKPNAEYVQQLDDYPEQSPKPLLLSLKPRYADLMFEGVKKAELRTQGIPSRQQPGPRWALRYSR